MNNEQRFAALADLCEGHGLTIEWRDLGERRHGQYRRGLKRIDLNPKLTLTLAVPALAHEFAHAVHDDGCSLPWAERRAWEYAARMIISSDDYRRAEAVVGPHPNAIAAELDLTPVIVRAWRRQEARRR